MPNPFTPEQIAQAAQQGWQLADVFDLKTRKLSIEIIPTWTHKYVQSAPVAVRVVSELARVKNDQLAMLALQIVMTSKHPKRSARK